MTVRTDQQTVPTSTDARSVTRVRDWPVWSTPPRVLTAVFTVETTAVLLVGLSVLAAGLPRLPDVGTAALLLVLGVLHTEVAIRVERARRQVDGALHVDLSSVWTFAAALVVPPVLAAALAVVLQLHVWWRAWYPRAPLYRQLFSVATIVLACLSAGTVTRLAGTTELIGGGAGADLLALAALVLAVLTYTTVNSGLVAGAILLSAAQPRVADALGDWEDNALEMATLFLGAITALAVLANPWLVPLVLPGILMLHRVVLVRHLQHAADTDPKTGLLNAAAWRVRVEQRLSARGARSAVLVVDLDHFKRVNDTHGHLVGDLVLQAVAAKLREEVRPGDVVGRFGGEEFVVLLAGAGDDHLRVAERIREGIGSLQVPVQTADGPLTLSGLTVSVGSAVHPDHGTDLTTLLQVADTALYAAKKAGRNAVRTGPVPAPRRAGAQPAAERE
jgi:diguanylate cyclase (GGDEF)-like protein